MMQFNKNINFYFSMRIKSVIYLGINIFFCIILGLFLSFNSAQAQSYPLPTAGNDVIGQLQFVTIRAGDTLYKISERYDISVPELLRANPGLNPRKLAIGKKITVPTQFILPAGKRQGIVINLAELRLFYFPTNQREVITYPIGIGRQGRGTPLLDTKIVEKRKDPTWYIPESIREEAAKEGKFLPSSMPPGPKNPLGQYALRLNPRSYLIHGTNAPQSIGTRASAGCIRLYPKDIAELYSLTSVNTPVRIVNQPYKVGWHNNVLYFQAFPAFHDYAQKSPPFSAVLDDFKQAEQQKGLKIDWPRLYALAKKRSGVPQPVALL